jgi:hypothetical protein
MIKPKDTTAVLVTWLCLKIQGCSHPRYNWGTPDKNDKEVK